MCKKVIIFRNVMSGIMMTVFVRLPQPYFIFLGITFYSTGTILEKDAYFPSLMDRHTSRPIFCKMNRYILY